MGLLMAGYGHRRAGFFKAPREWRLFSDVGIFLYCAKSNLAFSSGRVDTKKYIDALETNLFPFVVLTHGGSRTLQQDTAPAHNVRKVGQ